MIEGSGSHPRVECAASLVGGERRRDLPKRLPIGNRAFSRADVICKNSIVFVCSTNRNAFPTESVRDRVFEHYASNGRLVQTLDIERGDSIKRGAAVLESIISCPGCRAEHLPTSLALVATTLAPPSCVETMANDGSDVALSRGTAVPVGTVEALHGWWPCRTPKLMAWN
jgi:hypothetical protein